MPAISVIVPVYNVEKYLHHCVDSILAQTFTDFELIMVDDGSTDNSGKICDEYANFDNRFRVIHQKNQGQAVARNRALEIAQGEYIVFVDSDDYIHSLMFETLVCTAQQTNADIVRCNYIEGTDCNYNWQLSNKIVTKEYDSKSYLRASILNNTNGIWVLWDKIYRRSCFDEIRFPEGRIFEDNATVYKVLYYANTIVEIDSVFYYYFQNANSTTNQSFYEKKADWLIVLQEMISFYEEHRDKEVVEYLVNRYINDAVYIIYPRLVKYCPKSKRIKPIKKTIKTYYKKIKKKKHFNIKNSPEIYNIIYPSFSRAYWLFYRS